MGDFYQLRGGRRRSEADEQVERRKLTAEQKLQVLREAEQPGVTISEVCRRNRIAPSVFYRWRAVAQTDSASASKQDARRLPGKNDEQARREAEFVRLLQSLPRSRPRTWS